MVLIAPYLTHSQSDNDAGTLLPMELVHASADQPKKYAFHVGLYPLETRVKIVRWAIKDYYNSCVGQDDEDPETQDAHRGGPALKVLLAFFQRGRRVYGRRNSCRVPGNARLGGGSSRSQNDARLDTRHQ